MSNTRTKASIEGIVSPEMLRNVPGWTDAPVPACYGGDPRSLTFCCHPGYALTFANSCQRDLLLNRVKLSKQSFIRIKDEFSREHDWDDERVCFGSLAYCCMRNGGCPGNRDFVLREKYPGKSWDEIKRIYFSLKRELSIKILNSCKNKPLVQAFLDFEESR